MRAGLLVGLGALSLMAAGCAAPMGTVAGDVVGGAGWVALKTTKVAYKGTKFAVKTTGKTVVGAARGVHEEFSSDGDQQDVAYADDETPQGDASDQGEDKIGALSQSETATLPY